MNELLKLSRSEEGTVISVTNVNGIYFSKVRVDNFHAVDFPPDGLPLFQTVSPYPVTLESESRMIPKQGARCLVLLRNPENIDDGGYILGWLHNPMDQLIKKENTIEPSEGSHMVKTESGSGMLIENKKKETSVFAGDSALKINSNKAELKKGQSGIDISSRSITVKNEDDSAVLMLNKNESMISNDGNISFINPKGAQIYKALRKEEKFSGKIQTEASLIEEKSQMHVITSGYLKYMGLNGKAFGGDNTVELAALIGRMILTTTSGDMLLQNLNPLNKTSIFNGPSPSVKLTELTILSDKGTLKTVSPAGLIEILSELGEVKIKGLNGVDLSSTLKIKMEGTLGIEGKSSVNIKFESLLSAEFTGTTVKIGTESTVLNEIKGAMIKVGNAPIGFVVTTATSPFVDLITGVPQLGVPTFQA